MRAARTCTVTCADLRSREFTVLEQLAENDVVRTCGAGVCLTQMPLSAAGDHLRGMLQAGVSHFGAGQHASDFVGAGAVVEDADARLRAAVFLALLHGQMLIGEGCNLRQVGDAEDLLRAASALSFWPTASAARPPMPMSISSKTSVRGVVFFLTWARSLLRRRP